MAAFPDKGTAAGVDALDGREESDVASLPDPDSTADAQDGVMSDQPMPTVKALSAHLRLPSSFLREHGWTDTTENGRGKLTVTVKDECGSVLTVKVRHYIASGSGPKYTSLFKGQGAHVYGSHCLPWIRPLGFVVFVEGETDALACWFAGFPALGVPGASNAAKINADHLEQISRIFIVEEPGAAGPMFVSNVAARCRALGFTGSVRSLRMPGGAKDSCELRLQDPDRFAERFNGALETAGSVAKSDAGSDIVPRSTDETEPVTPMLKCAAEIEPEAVDWLWPPYIPKRKTTIVEGDGGLGKSWLTLAIAGGVSRGFLPPVVTGSLAVRFDPAPVVVANYEDGPGDTLRPRLDALGADVSLVHLLVRPEPLVGTALVEFEAEIARVRPALVIVDPFVAAMGPGVDLHRANEMRAVTGAFARIAERYDCAFILVRHLAKGRGAGHAINAGLGSIDIAAAVRSILLVGADPKDPTLRGVVQIKSNLAPTGKSFGFRLIDGQLEWTGESTLTADAILRPEQQDKPAGGRTPARDEARRFLEGQLANGPERATVIYEAAEVCGIARKTLERAKSEIGVESRKDGFQGRVRWYLPDGHTSPNSRQDTTVGGGDDHWVNRSDKGTYASTLPIHRLVSNPDGVVATTACDSDEMEVFE